MPRQARVIVPGFPHHIVQRGHNHQPVFALCVSVVVAMWNSIMLKQGWWINLSRMSG